MKTQIQALTTAMTNSISSVLETMFFLPLEIDGVVGPETVQLPQDDAVMAARLAFRGPLTGYSAFCVPEKVAVAITADFLGISESEISTDQIRGTVNEIINMLTGDTFSHYDPQAVFDLSIPESVHYKDIFDKAGPEGEDEITIVIRTAEDHLAFRMIIES